MPHESQDISPVFRIDVAQSASEPVVGHGVATQNEITALLHQLVAGQDRQNELMEEMIEQMNAFFGDWHSHGVFATALENKLFSTWQVSLASAVDTYYTNLEKVA